MHFEKKKTLTKNRIVHYKKKTAAFFDQYSNRCSQYNNDISKKHRTRARNLKTHSRAHQAQPRAGHNNSWPACTHIIPANKDALSRAGRIITPSSQPPANINSLIRPINPSSASYTRARGRRRKIEKRIIARINNSSLINVGGIKHTRAGSISPLSR